MIYSVHLFIWGIECGERKLRIGSNFFMGHYSVIPLLIAETIAGAFNGSIAVMALSWVAMFVLIWGTCCCAQSSDDEEEPG